MLPPIQQEPCEPGFPPNRALSRSASQPVIFPLKQRSDFDDKQQHTQLEDNVSTFVYINVLCTM